MEKEREYLGTQDTYYVGTIKSVGRIYQQTFLDTYTKVAFAKLYDRKNALVAADLLNNFSSAPEPERSPAQAEARPRLRPLAQVQTGVARIAVENTNMLHRHQAIFYSHSLSALTVSQSS